MLNKKTQFENIKKNNVSVHFKSDAMNKKTDDEEPEGCVNVSDSSMAQGGLSYLPHLDYHSLNCVATDDYGSVRDGVIDFGFLKTRFLYSTTLLLTIKSSRVPVGSDFEALVEPCVSNEMSAMATPVPADLPLVMELKNSGQEDTHVLAFKIMYKPSVEGKHKHFVVLREKVTCPDQPTPGVAVRIWVTAKVVRNNVGKPTLKRWVQCEAVDTSDCDSDQTDGA